VVPTPAGEFVVARARQLVFNSRCLERDVELYRSRSLGDTAFGVGPFPAATFISSLLGDLRREFPGINLRVEVSNSQLLHKRLLEEDIEFFVSDTGDLPDDSQLQIRPLERLPAVFCVRVGHPLAEARTVTLEQVWACGVASVRLPTRPRALLAQVLGIAPPAEPGLALECDDVDILKRVVLACDSVLIAPRESLRQELAAGQLHMLRVEDLPPLQASELGVVILRGRTPSPMASLIIDRLPVRAASAASADLRDPGIA
jgi:DNA-binding transcriptional LysR family regulator